MGELRVTIDYEPRRQFVEFHNRTERWACLVAHRRAGKTVACINDLIRDAMTAKHPNARVAYIAPYLVQARDIAWQYAKEFSRAIPGTTYNETELRVDFPNGARLRLYGSDNYERLRGLGSIQ
jgi:phage terminase large subunit